MAGWVDRLNRAVGGLVSWLALAMVLIGAFNAVARYLGQRAGENLSSNAYIELQWYLFSALFLLGAANTLREDAHVRVDVFYGRLPARGKAWIDLAGSLLLLLPFCAFALYMSWPAVANSWAIREISPDPGGLPRYPIKALILVSFGLLALQGVSQLIKHLAQVLGRELPPEERD
ncbi:MAG: TRAP transporter small permease subunit [Myxococcales bacterium]|nr:TRAP transporter small permease subunit [Myxococcales bacterium]